MKREAIGLGLFLFGVAWMEIGFLMAPLPISGADNSENEQPLVRVEQNGASSVESNVIDLPEGARQPSGTEGVENTYYGYFAGIGNSGHWVTFIGAEAGRKNTRELNTFVGYHAGYSKTEGGEDIYNTAPYGTFIGAEAGAGGNSGESNTFVGQRSGWKNTSGHSNTFVGRNAGAFNTLGDSNTFIGRAAGYKNKQGFGNTFVGYYAGYNTTTDYYSDSGLHNTFIGGSTGYLNSTGDRNVFIGHNAGYQNDTGSDNVFLGYRAGFYETGSDKLYIDNSHTDTPLIWGDFEIHKIQVNGDFRAVASSTTSDGRLKKNIQPLTSSLDKIFRLQGVSYEWMRDEYPGKGLTEGKQIGLIAQDVEQVLPELVSEDKDGYKAVSYTKLSAVLVEAVKELKAQNEKQQAEIEALKALIKELKS